MYTLKVLRRILIETDNLRTGALDLSLHELPNRYVNPSDAGPAISFLGVSPMPSTSPEFSVFRARRWGLAGPRGRLGGGCGLWHKLDQPPPFFDMCD